MIRTFKIHGHSFSVPELDAFLDDYRALCERHGIMFEQGSDIETGYERVSLVEYDGGDVDGFLYEDLSNVDVGVVKRVTEPLWRLVHEELAPKWGWEK
jgi:hypothetical protein